jgi:choline dehydrogenase-like flavoprotein
MANTNEYDAIVVGSGISGGWAAKELCEKGLKTLVLERGRKLDHVLDYTTTNMAPWEFSHRGKPTQEDKEIYPIQTTVYAFNEGTRHLWIKDNENPYTTPEGQPYYWIRGDHVGGRSIMWGRQVYRWSDLDFEANAKDGIAVDWPIRYKDIAPWYDYVERFIGVSGQKEGLPQLPDGQFMPPMEMNCIEKHAKKTIEAKWPDRRMTIGRTANITENHNGRVKCQHRNLCYRGCPYGAYFSSQSGTLPAATATGNMTLKPDSMVESVLYDMQNDRATGVRVIDAVTKEVSEHKAKVIFLCASTLGTTHLLLNSANERFSEGLANSSGELGKNLMDHQMGGATCTMDGWEDSYYFGGRPNGIYIPRFRNIKDKHPDFIRGYGYQGRAARTGWEGGATLKGFGAEFKDSLTKPGPWTFAFSGFGETLPDPSNKVVLNKEKKDKFGLPVLHIDAKYGENDLIMRKDYKDTAAEMLEAIGGKNILKYDGFIVPGSGIHEMGTARMGKDPKTSVLNKWNQSHDISNLFVTDGSFMASAGCQNPSLTYMAMTARAVDYCVKEMKKGNIK